jgi:hypothetical protein
LETVRFGRVDVLVIDVVCKVVEWSCVNKGSLFVVIESSSEKEGIMWWVGKDK